jgi:hypothetical protein
VAADKPRHLDSQRPARAVAKIRLKIKIRCKIEPVLASLSLLVVAPAFLPPQSWALNFAAPPRIPLLGDVNNDGRADLLCVYPPGASIIDVSINVDGQKPGRPVQGLTQWGQNCQAAAVGPWDTHAGDDVVGIFDGQTLRLAVNFTNGKFTDVPDWLRLPEKLDKPQLSNMSGKILAFSTTTGKGFLIQPQDRKTQPFQVPRGLAHLEGAHGDLIGTWANGAVRRLEQDATGQALRVKQELGRLEPGSRSSGIPGAAVVRSGTGFTPAERYPRSPAHYFFADIDADGDLDLVEFRYGKERHTAFAILVHRQLTPGEQDPDHDGLSNEEEAQLGTDPHNPDTDGDGLLDGWEVKGHRGLDLPDMGCNPRRMDVICLISRFDDVPEDRVKSELERAVKTYAELDVENVDGSRGWNLHIVYRDPVTGDDKKSSWGVNRDTFLPREWRGMVRWMQITQGGGGQADQLGDGGTCGVNALWAVFLHEFGHQLGMDHHGFWGPGHCPIYTSLMNYAYSYSVEDDGAKIRYSDGRFAKALGGKGYTINETRLDETIPLPYDQVKFLESGPYRFRLKPNGDTTLIDWNWNGVFGEKNIRADINYAYSTTAGDRHEIDKIHSAPWLFTHGNSAYALYGKHGFPGDVKTDPSTSLEKPGALLLRRLISERKWEDPVTVESGGLVGDPVAVSHRGWILAVYPTREGVVMRRIRYTRGSLTMSPPQVLDKNPKKVPTVGVSGNRAFIFLWEPSSGEVQYRTVGFNFELSQPQRLYSRSTIPPGMAVDTVRNEIVLGMAQNQDEKRPSRWQIRRFQDFNGILHEKEWEWVEGPDGQARGLGRCTLLFKVDRDTGPAGRLYFFAKGMHGAEHPWACTFVAESIADKTVRGGWLVKRYYDEWTQSRSAPAAVWWNHDILWAYRWVDASQNDRDNVFHIGYRGLGIQDEDMGDHDDLAFFRDFGIRYGILWLNP